MDDDLKEMARLHSAGATVSHSSPFDSLPTHKNEADLSSEFIKKWAVPFYMEIGSYHDDKWIDAIKEIKNEITIPVCLELLGDFNWRTRLVGAYFTAVKNFVELVDIIGVHLLKSEVCCVGNTYALTLAFFNTDKSNQYLVDYLDYYLTTPLLYFDQSSVLEALLYLDKENGTNHFEKYHIQWESLEKIRKPLEQKNQQYLAEILKNDSVPEHIVASITQETETPSHQFTTAYYDHQIKILSMLSQYH